MDSTRSKRRSFPKSKLIRSFYRAATKPSGSAAQPYSSKSSPAPSSAAPVGFIIVNQDQVFPQQTSKVAFVVTDRNRDSYGKLENFYAADDEGVDDKASKYISGVQERFRLEGVNSERKNIVEDICV
ncbi:hypothetical protein ACS0TY_000455 [Phlomoides rotata]